MEENKKNSNILFNIIAVFACLFIMPLFIMLGWNCLLSRVFTVPIINYKEAFTAYIGITFLLIPFKVQWKN